MPQSLEFIEISELEVSSCYKEGGDI